MAGSRGPAPARRLGRDVDHHGQEVPVVGRDRYERSRQTHGHQGRRLARACPGPGGRLPRRQHGHEERVVDDPGDVSELAGRHQEGPANPDAPLAHAIEVSGQPHHQRHVDRVAEERREKREGQPRDVGRDDGHEHRAEDGRAQPARQHPDEQQRHRAERGRGDLHRRDEIVVAEWNRGEGQMEGRRVREGIGLPVGLGPPHAVLPDVDGGGAEEIEAGAAHDLDQARVRAQVGIVEVGMVHGQRSEQERGQGEGGQRAHVGRRGPAARDEDPARGHAHQAEEGEGQYHAPEQAVDKPRVVEEADDRRRGPRRREQQRAAPVPAGEHVQRDEKGDQKSGRDPRATPQGQPGRAGQPHPVELQPEVLPLVRVGVEGGRHRRRAPRSQGHRALLESAAAALEAVDDRTPEEDLDHRRLREDAREPVRQRHRPPRNRQRQRHACVVGGPVRGDAVVDLVGGGEARNVRGVAGPEVQRDLERTPRAPPRRRQRKRHDGEREHDVAARAPPVNQ